MDDINDSLYIWETKVDNIQTFNKSKFYRQSQAQVRSPSSKPWPKSPKGKAIDIDPGQQGVLRHFQGEHYQRKVLGAWGPPMIKIESSAFYINSAHTVSSVWLG